MKDKSLRIAFVVLLIAVICLSYSNTFDSPFLYDGIEMIKNNPRIKSMSKALKYLSEFNRSVTYLTFALNYRLSGMDSTGYHILNLILHILTTLGVYYFIYRTSVLVSGQRTGKTGINQRSRWIAALGAFIFGVHPVHTEAVTYIYQRATVLSAMFYIFSMIAYIRFRTARTKLKKWMFVGTLILCGYLGTASKANAFMFPFFIVLYEFYFFKDLDWRKMGKNFLYILPAGGLMFAFAIYVNGMNFMNTMFSRYAQRPFTLTERLLTELRVVVYYISLFFYPDPSRLKLAYDLKLSTSLIAPVTTLFSLLVIAGVLTLAVFSAKKYKMISFGIFWFFGNLLLESTVFPLKLIFEHRLYLPSVGLLFIFSVLFVGIIRKQTFFREKTGGITAIIIVLVLISTLGFWTYQRNQVWRGELSIWKDAVSKTPESVEALNAVGDAYIRRNIREKGIKYLKRALEIDPDHYKVLNNLGITYGKHGNCRKAVKYFKRAVEQKPDKASPYVNLGNCYYTMGDVDKALRYYHKSMKINPEGREAIYNMIICYRKKEKYRKAYQLARKLVNLHPDDQRAQSVLRDIKKILNGTGR